jgi:hypothetical protein
MLLLARKLACILCLCLCLSKVSHTFDCNCNVVSGILICVFAIIKTFGHLFLCFLGCMVERLIDPLLNSKGDLRTKTSMF